MKQNSKQELTPKLRFPEFRDGPGWTKKRLGDAATLVTERAGDKECTPFTVSSGIGLVSQQEKLGRMIAGNQLKSYVLLQKNDFAYNKSATKAYPEGFIARYAGDEQAAVPNSIFTCFRVDKRDIDPAYLDYLFAGNLHGKWLKRYIAVGARAHGSLNVNDADLLALPVPIPSGASSLDEQRKIADCLCSLDDVTAAQAGKVEALKAHKKRLMQQLFPREREMSPRLRFSEFRDAPEWNAGVLGDIAEISSGSTPLRSKAEFYEGGSIPWVKTTDLNNSIVTRTEECITAKARAKINPVGSVLVAMYGGFRQIGRTGYLQIPAATNQALSVLNVDQSRVLPTYLLIWLNAKVDHWKRIASSSRKDPNITGSDVARFPIRLPAKAEQQKVVDCLFALDNVIIAQSQQLATLKTYKAGLMQQLFPSPQEFEA